MILDATITTKKSDSELDIREARVFEELYIGTADSEHLEMYLKAIWHIRERGEEPKISSIAKLLNIRQPSVVEMLRKLNEAKLVEYEKGAIVELKPRGERIGKQMIRNTRLLEVLMKDALKIYSITLIR
jgi:DtxR family transcriptional regulator, Mn-dependent transcriptional regulator